MKFLPAFIFLGLGALVACRPDGILDLDLEDIQHEFDGDVDHIEGMYSWTSPEGVDYYVKYVADDDGYRILESNAVPTSHSGVLADGHQVSFLDYEGDD